MASKRLLLALPLLAAMAGDARASLADGKLPDGVYHCEVYMLGMFLGLGDVTVKGRLYSGPALFDRIQQSYHYQMSPTGEITWLGPLGGYTSGGNSISLTQATLDDGQEASFDIVMRQPDGAFTASTCTKRDPAEKS